MKTCKDKRHPDAVVVTTHTGCPLCLALVDLDELREAYRREHAEVARLERVQEPRTWVEV